MVPKVILGLSGLSFPLYGMRIIDVSFKGGVARLRNFLIKSRKNIKIA